MSDSKEIDFQEPERYEWYRAAMPVLAFILICILVQALGRTDWFESFLKENTGLESISQLGIFPRYWLGLKGILFWPLIHGDWRHLLNNAWPLALMGTLMFKNYPKHALKICSFFWLAGGLAVWLSARPGSFHIGASGIVYGMAFFLIFMGFFRKDRNGLAISFLVILIHAGLIWGLLPIREGISWEGHLSGALAGVVMAIWYRDDYKPDIPEWMKDEAEDERPFFQKLEEEKKFGEDTGPPTIRYEYRPGEEEENS